MFERDLSIPRVLSMLGFEDKSCEYADVTYGYV